MIVCVCLHCLHHGAMFVLVWMDLCFLSVPSHINVYAIYHKLCLLLFVLSGSCDALVSKLCIIKPAELEFHSYCQKMPKHLSVCIFSAVFFFSLHLCCFSLSAHFFSLSLTVRKELATPVENTFPTTRLWCPSVLCFLLYFSLPYGNMQR